MDRPVAIIGLPAGAGTVSSVVERLRRALEPAYLVIVVASEQRVLTVNLIPVPKEQGERL